MVTEQEFPKDDKLGGKANIKSNDQIFCSKCNVKLGIVGKENEFTIRIMKSPNTYKPIKYDMQWHLVCKCKFVNTVPVRRDEYENVKKV